MLLIEKEVQKKVWIGNSVDCLHKSGSMMTYWKILERVLSRQTDANIRFDDLRNLMIRLGLEERNRGSHPVFIREGVKDLINLQREAIWRNPIRCGRFEP
jgi:hypothetical protein